MLLLLLWVISALIPSLCHSSPLNHVMSLDQWKMIFVEDDVARRIHLEFAEPPVSGLSLGSFLQPLMAAILPCNKAAIKAALRSPFSSFRHSGLEQLNAPPTTTSLRL